MRMKQILQIALTVSLLAGAALPVMAQPGGRGYVLGNGPWYYNTADRNTHIKVSVVTKGLSHPWSMAFLPGTSTEENSEGDMLITERNLKAIRLLRNGKLQPDSVADLSGLEMDVLFDIALHPDFSDNGWVYITYMKNGPKPEGARYYATTALARGTWDGNRINDMKDIFVADAWSVNQGSDASRITFAPDGTLFMSSSHRRHLEGYKDTAQDLNSHIGKILRLNDDGTPAAGNPYIGRSDAKPEIYSRGHRTVLGLVPHPVTGVMWETENGPQGGDEVNILQAGGNYGWPLISFGRDYDGTHYGEGYVRDDMLNPELFWVPSITASGITFYTGDQIPAWKNNLFVGAMTVGRFGGTGHIQRIRFNENGEMGREQLLNDLHQRIRDIRMGPDELLYLLTDENDGALLRIEPVP